MIHGRTHTARAVGIAALVLLAPRGAFALDPSLDVSQYAHTAWRARDGFVRGQVTSIAQTPDGYLWVGTDDGLLRFDGVRAVPFRPPGEQLPATDIAALLVARDGTLWIGTGNGLASWKDGKLSRYPELSTNPCLPLQQDREGTVWIGTQQPGSICKSTGGRIECEGKERLGRFVNAVYEDSSGALWIAAQSGVWRWRPGPPRHYPLPPGATDTTALIEERSGVLLLATNDGVKRLADGEIGSERVPELKSISRPVTFLRSRDGSLWVGGHEGLSHVHAGRTDHFGYVDGLSAQSVLRIYEDREGNIWAATASGFDRFRDFRFPTISADQGLASSLTWAVQAASDGSIWIASSQGLNRWHDGRVTFYDKRPLSPSPRTADVRVVPLLQSTVRSMRLDERDRLWVGVKDAVFRIEDERAERVPDIPGGRVLSIAPDGRGTVWISNEDAGLFRWAGDGAVQRFPWAFFGKAANGSIALLPDAVQRGLWIGFRDDGVAYFDDGRVVRSWGAADGLAPGQVMHLRFGEQGAVWAATAGGLSRIADGKVRTLTAKQGLPCDAAHWSMEDEDHSTWIYMTCGLVRIGRAELEEWLKSADRPIETTVFDTADGVRMTGINSYIATFGPPVTKRADGTIWFAHDDGVTRIDPHNLPRNALPPPVHIEQLMADGKIYDATAGPLRLPPRVRDLGIDYTALSLVVPEKVRFRVKLEGQDGDWRELVNDRHVEYTNLEPKHYRFRVTAANESGVWNEEGASLAFTIAPAFYETGWFRALSVAALAALLWAGHRFRVGVLERHQREITALNEQLMKAQEEERTRIAGELHDGVLQQLTSVTLNLGAVKHRVPRDSPAKAEIATAQSVLTQIGTDIRQLSHELHPAVLHDRGLPDALAVYCKEFSATRGIPVSCEAEPGVKELSQGAALALYRIAQEALGNAAKHARARQVRVRLARTDAVVRLSVSDDGVGLDQGRADDRGVGLVNMRERVRQLGGKLELESEPGLGTTIRAEVPFRRA